MELDSVLIRDHSMQKAKFLPRKTNHFPFPRLQIALRFPVFRNVFLLENYWNYFLITSKNFEGLTFF